MSLGIVDLFEIDFDQPVETLARWYCEFNRWEWPGELVHLKPEDYPGTSMQEAAHAIWGVMRHIEGKIGEKECLRWHWLNNLQRTNEAFEHWYDHERIY
jgi:hypothetical protein